MRASNAWILLTLLFALGCSIGSGNATPFDPADPATLPNPEINTSSVPDPDAAVRAYLDAWSAFDYESMYSMLTNLSRDAVSFEEFEGRYRQVAAMTNLSGVDYDILQSLIKSAESAQVSYRVLLQSAILGQISRETSMRLSRSGEGEWQVVWDEQLILPELVDGNKLSLERFVPSRGIIYDRNGSAIAVDAEIVAISVIPSAIDEDDADGLVSQLATLLGLDADFLSGIIFAEDAPFLLALGVVSQDEFNQREAFVSPYYYALQVITYSGRYYPDGSAGPQITGYVGPIPADQVEEWIKNGYQSDDFIGRIGIEAAFEDELAGTFGGALYLINAEGAVVTTLAQSDSLAAASVYLTIEKDFQVQAQKAMGESTGAVVVLERDTGRILAIVSSPDFNPNASDPNSPFFSILWNDYLDDERTPFFNRALFGQYPPGSIFKVISMAAALESGLYSSQSELYCGYTWNRFGLDFVDWTKEKGQPESGQLNLLQGLMRSCNPWFYEIGYVLYTNGFPTLISEMARGFGLGSPTGFSILGEEAGRIDELDLNNPSVGVGQAVQQGIGQHTVLITPLQAAVYVAALGNGGTLYQPQLIEYLERTDGSRSLLFDPIINGTLPISENTLLAIQTAMVLVVKNPRGTAYRTFGSFSIRMAGKTGTASVPNGDPHAWFIGYTTNENPDRPDIAIIVIVENGGEGSEVAAPIFRRLVEIYFSGRPLSLYPWEEKIGVEAATPDPDEEINEEEDDLEQ